MLFSAAGIPDFRTPGTGLYDNLQKYNLPEPQAVFHIEYFRQNPKPFCMLAKELYPTNFKVSVLSYTEPIRTHDTGMIYRSLPDSEVVKTIVEIVIVISETLHSKGVLYSICKEGMCTCMHMCIIYIPHC